MNIQSKLVVTAAEFTRQFGQLRHGPGDPPIFVTHHGRETHVLMGRAHYDSLRADAPAGERSDPLPAIAGLAGMLPQGVLLLDAGGTIFAANCAAGTMLGHQPEGLAGRPFADALPEIASSPIGGCIRRALDSGEAQCADLPSPARPGRWLQVDCRPAPGHTVVLLHDITEDVLRHRLADRDRAAAQAMRLHGAVGEIALSMRGQVDAADGVVCDWLGLAEDRIHGVALADLMPVPERPALREALDAVLRGHGPTTFAGTLVSNRGEAVAVSIALVELRGVYGSEGAVALLTRR